jgi:putative oxidoreductase
VFEQANLYTPRNVLGDWILRAGIALMFVVFGAEKFPAGGDSNWVKFFAQVGAGQWFRYFTGAIEILGGVLVLIPWTATAGLALLASTMAGAVLILVFVLGRPADSVFAALLCMALTGFGWTRRRV